MRSCVRVTFPCKHASRGAQNTFCSVQSLPGFLHNLNTTTLWPPGNIQVQLSWGMARGMGHVYSRIFSCQHSCFFQLSLVFKFLCLWTIQFVWLIIVVLILNLSRHPGLSAVLFCSLLIGQSIPFHFPPYGTYSLWKCLVYILFIYGMLVCVSYPLIPWSTASVSLHVFSLWALLSKVPWHTSSALSFLCLELTKPRELA